MGKKGQPVTTFRKPKAEEVEGERLKVKGELSTLNSQLPLNSKLSTLNYILNPVESDEFNSSKLGLQWEWHANYDEKFGTATAFGTYRIYTYKLSEGWKNFWEVPNLLLQKTPADEFTVTTKVRFTSKAEGQFGGLIMMGLDYSALVVKRVGKEFQLVQMTCLQADKGKPQTETVLATLKPTAEDKIDYKPGIHEDIYLRLKVTLPDAAKLKNKSAYEGKPVVNFSYSLDGKKFTDCGEQFQMKQGKWIGAKFGYVSAETDPKADRGYLVADWIRITK
jgi:beta-xylosidase